LNNKKTDDLTSAIKRFVVIEVMTMCFHPLVTMLKITDDLNTIRLRHTARPPSMQQVSYYYCLCCYCIEIYTSCDQKLEL